MLNGDETRGEPKCTACEKAKGTTFPPPPGFFSLFSFSFRGRSTKWMWPDIRLLGAEREAKSTSGVPRGGQNERKREREIEENRSGLFLGAGD